MARMDEKRHRWFRFSLRALFVLVTLVALSAGWVSWSTIWIRDRRAFVRDDGDTNAIIYNQPGQSVVAPSLLWLFGEEGAQFVVLFGEDESDFSDARRLFPEAEVVKPAWQWGVDYQPLEP
jgi:hypothetical protein